MRLALRSMTDSALEELTAMTSRIVVIGFKHPGSDRGVTARGRRLVEEQLVVERERTIDEHIARVLYRFKRIPAVAVELRSAASVRGLRAIPWIDYIQPATAEMTFDQQDPDGTGCFSALGNAQVIPWNITRIRADQAWAQATGTNGAILVLDNGLDLSLDPTSGYAELPWSAAYEVLGQSSEPEDGSHGTLTASVAAARNNGFGVVGVAPGSALHYGDIEPGGFPGLGWQNAAAAMIDAALPETKVVSISYSSKQSYLPSGFLALYDAINEAYFQRGMIIVASTGNQESASIQSYPARWPQVVGVGGANLNDQWIHNNYASENVELAAPSVSVGIVCKGAALSGNANGTSFATPAVAGAFMLMRQRYPTLSNDALRERVRLTAVPMASTLRSGAGRLDILAALNYTPPAPPLVVSIEGYAEVQPWSSCLYSATVSGGYPQSYQWKADGVLVGDGTQTYRHSAGSAPFQLEVLVYDENNRVGIGQRYVTVSGSAGPCNDY